MNSCNLHKHVWDSNPIAFTRYILAGYRWIDQHDYISHHTHSLEPVVIVRGGTAGGGELTGGCDACATPGVVANLRGVSPICHNPAPLCSHGLRGVAMSAIAELEISEMCNTEESTMHAQLVLLVYNYTTTLIEKSNSSSTTLLWCHRFFLWL